MKCIEEKVFSVRTHPFYHIGAPTIRPENSVTPIFCNKRRQCHANNAHKYGIVWLESGFLKIVVVAMMTIWPMMELGLNCTIWPISQVALWKKGLKNPMLDIKPHLQLSSKLKGRYFMIAAVWEKLFLVNNIFAWAAKDAYSTSSNISYSSSNSKDYRQSLGKT